MFWVPVYFYPQQHEQISQKPDEPVVKTQPPQNEEGPAIKIQKNDSNDAKEEIFNKLLIEELGRKEQNNFRKNWTPQEQNILVQLRKKGESWQNISLQLPGTTAIKCMRRFQRIQKTTKKWPKELDDKIIHLREVEGQDWQQIKNNIKEEGNFYTTKELRMRYTNYLRPGIDKDKWSFEEDMKLIELSHEHNRKWKKISPLFPNRTELQIKNRYSRTLEPSILKVKKKLSKIYCKNRHQ